MADSEKAIAFLRKMQENGFSIDDLINVIEHVASIQLADSSSKQLRKRVTPTLKTTINEIMHEIGVQPHFKGYAIIERSIELVYEDLSLINEIRKKVYVIVANEFNTKIERLDLNNFKAIDYAWKNGNREAFQKYFGNNNTSKLKKPTSTEFIATIAKYLQVNYKL